MRRVMLVHLLLCALLAFQQPSVLVRTGAWVQERSTAGDSREAPNNGVLEEEKVPAMYAGSVWRLKVPAGASGGRRPAASRPERRPPAPACERGHAHAREHWRGVQLPPRAGPDDDPFQRA